MALEAGNATGERWHEAEIHRRKGRCLLAHPQRAVEAESSYRRALAVARGQQAKFWELRASTSLARLWRDQGKRSEARDLLAPIYGWFTEGFDTPMLQEAKALLDELAPLIGRVIRRTTGPRSPRVSPSLVARPVESWRFALRRNGRFGSWLCEKAAARKIDRTTVSSDRD
jgi:hypothetical protein